jgi:hypothetical protein
MDECLEKGLVEWRNECPDADETLADKVIRDNAKRWSSRVAQLKSDDEEFGTELFDENHWKYSFLKSARLNSRQTLLNRNNFLKFSVSFS